MLIRNACKQAGAPQCNHRISAGRPLEQRPVPAVSCRLRSKATHAGSASATVSPASAEQAVSSQRSRPLSLRSRSLGARASTFVFRPAEQGFAFASARLAGPTCSTRRKATRIVRSASPSAALAIRSSPLLKIPSMTPDATPGFSSPLASRFGLWIPIAIARSKARLMPTGFSG